MKFVTEKNWHRGETWLTVGLSLNDWALPLHIEAIRPYTTMATPTQPERWKSQVVFTVLCFYAGVEWL
jgi:hypothetical protein